MCTVRVWEDELDNVRHSLAEQGESPEAVQELLAAALVEVQSGQGGGRLLQPEDDEGPAFLLHRDGPELADGEGQRPPAPLVAVVDRDCGSEHGGGLGRGGSFTRQELFFSS